MTELFSLIGSLFGYVLWFFFEIFKNYGVAIFFFAVVLKLIMFPSSIVQQKSMAKSAKLNAKQKELQKNMLTIKINLTKKLINYIKKRELIL